MFDTPKIVTGIEGCKNKQSISQQLCRGLLVVFVILITFIGISEGESMEEPVSSQEISSNIIVNTQTAENSLVASNEIEQNLEQNLLEKEKQAISGTLQDKESFFAKGLSYIKGVMHKLVPYHKRTVPLGFWKGFFMMCCVALALSFKNFVTLFLVAVLYWMGLLYLPESCAWFKSYTCLFVLFILSGIEIACSIVGSLIKIIMNEIAKADKDFKESQLLQSLLFLVPIMFFLGNKIMSETFFLVRWGICAGLIYFVLEVRKVLNFWGILKLICEVSFSWWLEPILLLVFLVATCLWLPVVGVWGSLVLLGAPLIVKGIEETLK